MTHRSITTKEAVAKDLEDLLQSWEAKRPVSPYRTQPTFRGAIENGAFGGTAIPFALLGLLLGLAITLSGPPDSGETSIFQVSAWLWMPFACGFGIPTALVILIDSINGLIFLARHIKWRRYVNELTTWAIDGADQFRKYRTTHPNIRRRVWGY